MTDGGHFEKGEVNTLSRVFSKMQLNKFRPRNPFYNHYDNTIYGRSFTKFSKAVIIQYGTITKIFPYQIILMYREFNPSTITYI